MRTTIIILLAIGLSQSAAGQPADDCFNYDADHLRGIGALIGVDSAHSVAVAGALAAVAAWDEGLVVVDLANPEWPLEIGRIDTPGYVRSVAVAGGLVYAVDVAGLGPDGGRSGCGRRPRAPGQPAAGRTRLRPDCRRRPGLRR